MKKIILLRHGESIWNKKNIFTGWIDVNLSQQGILEAKKVGSIFKKKNINIEYAYTSFLKRAINTLWYVLNELDLLWINNFKSWKLNERHYGKLQGKNKKEIIKIYGEKKVFKWRRSYIKQPPKITQNSNKYPGKDIKYRNIKEKYIPTGESLKDTFNRVVPFWKNNIIKNIKKNKLNTILIVAHGNSLRSLIKYIENISDKKIENIEILTCKPLIYELDKNFKFIKKYYIK